MTEPGVGILAVQFLTRAVTAQASNRNADPNPTVHPGGLTPTTETGVYDLLHSVRQEQ
jgi:hypothetical protein